MCLAELVDNGHTCGIISITQPVHQSIGCIVITDRDHGIKIRVYGIFAVLFCDLFIILIDGTHDIELDQAGSLH